MALFRHLELSKNSEKIKAYRMKSFLLIFQISEFFVKNLMTYEFFSEMAKMALAKEES
jgi:hypothetical protein